MLGMSAPASRRDPAELLRRSHRRQYQHRQHRGAEPAFARPASCPLTYILHGHRRRRLACSATPCNRGTRDDIDFSGSSPACLAVPVACSQGTTAYGWGSAEGISLNPSFAACDRSFNSDLKIACSSHFTRTLSL